MFIKNGMVYAGSPETDIKVADARYVGNKEYVVTFSTGETRLFDATSLEGMPAFASLENEDVLRAFEIDHGVLTWNSGEIDIAPEALYDASYQYGLAV